jgi:hypothetical protein
MINQQYRNNQKLINNHFLNLLIVAVILLAISFYFFLLNWEENAFAKTKADLLQDEVVVTKDKLASLECNVLQE